MKKFEFSKLVVVIAILINIAIIGLIGYIVYQTKDTTPLCYLAIGDGGALATCGAFYFWKAKNENRYKHAQRIMEEWADKYGVETAIQLADTVLKD